MQEGHFVGVGVAKYFDRGVDHARRGRRYGDAVAEAVLAAWHVSSYRGRLRTKLPPQVHWQQDDGGVSALLAKKPQ